MNKPCKFETTIAFLGTGLVVAYLVSSFLPGMANLAGMLFIGAIFLTGLVFTCGRRAKA